MSSFFCIIQSSNYKELEDSSNCYIVGWVEVHNPAVSRSVCVRHLNMN